MENVHTLKLRPLEVIEYVLSNELISLKDEKKLFSYRVLKLRWSTKYT